MGRYRQEQPPAPESDWDEKLVMLRSWQSQRLARTHFDLLSSPRYAPACKFFLSDVYAASDFVERDHDIRYLYEIMSRFLPPALLTLVREVIELNDLSFGLDNTLLRALIDDLGVSNEITPELYAEGYRICDNYDDRVTQIELLIQVGRKVDLTTKIPLVSTTLKLASRPARRAGWHELHDFLERGFKAFKHMRGAKGFLDTIYRREKTILDRIFASHPEPFQVE